VTTPSDFGVFKNVHANAQQFTLFKLKQQNSTTPQLIWIINVSTLSYNTGIQNTYQPHALLLNFAHPESHEDRKPKTY